MYELLLTVTGNGKTTHHVEHFATLVSALSHAQESLAIAECTPSVEGLHYAISTEGQLLSRGALSHSFSG